MSTQAKQETERATVALAACATYDRETVQAATERCIALVGGMGSLVGSGGNVLVKPNLLVGIAPKRAVTTHPEVLRAALTVIAAAGATARVGDCPMFTDPVTTMRRSGLLAVMDELDVQPADMKTATVISAPADRSFGRLEVVESAMSADLLVNICKLKAHGLTGLTLALKNIFGLIPGLEKSKWHLKAPTAMDMCSMLVDLFEAVQLNLREHDRKLLHICDGVVGLEGEGPSAAGTPKQVGVIAASTDAVALDAVLTRLVGFDVDFVPTTTIAAERGLGVADLDRIDVVGDDLEGLALAPGSFEPNRGSLRSGAAFVSWPFTSKFVRNRMVERPVIDLDACEGCGECRKVCASKAIVLEGKPKKAVIDYDKCIRCYCCMEVCQYSAALLGPRPILARLADASHLLPWAAGGLLVALAAAGYLVFR